MFHYSFYVIIGLFLMMPYVIGPILVYRKHRMPFQQEFYPLLDEELTTVAATPGFKEKIDDLESIGFERVANLQSITSSATLYTAVFHNFSTLERAHVSVITSVNHQPSCDEAAGPSKPIFKVLYTEFTSCFANSLEVNTNNSSTPRVFGITPDKQVTSLPGVVNASQIYAVHRYLTASIPDEMEPLPSADRIAQRFSVDWSRTLRTQTELGYMFRDTATSTYRPTPKGALLMTWKMLWPVKPIRAYLVRKEAGRLVSTVS